MLQSQLFTKTRREAPKDEQAKNAQLLIRAGFIHKEMSGVYSILPLGHRVMNKIINIVRNEMDNIGGQEVSLTALQEKNSWQKTGRWDDSVIDVWFKTALKNGTELALACTHEEPLTYLMTNFIKSYRDLPKYVYQFQTKFRNELRAKSGIMRGREFLMKDLYSFSADLESHERFYSLCAQAYTNIFNRVGIGHVTYMTSASGGSFSKFSHEFQTITDAGEDIIYTYERDGKKLAINKEIMSPELCKELNVNESELVERKSVEVGNIFNLGTRFSEPLELMAVGQDGKRQPVIMGSYGIGIGRLMGTVVEVLSDKEGIVWPENIAPYNVHIILIGEKESLAHKKAKEIYAELLNKGIEVLFDDRDTRPGEKFADSDLIGIPWRITVSDKLAEKDTVEFKNRKTGDVSIVSTSECASLIIGKNK